MQEQLKMIKKTSKRMPFSIALEQAMRNVLQEQLQHVAITRRLSEMVVDIWQLQYRIQKQAPRDVNKIISHPRFRAAYDFLLLRHKAGEKVGDLATWWTQYQEVDEKSQRAMVDKLRERRSGQQRRRAPKKST
jgi:poly(A) polymerase